MALNDTTDKYNKKADYPETKIQVCIRSSENVVNIIYMKLLLENMIIKDPHDTNRDQCYYYQYCK